VFCDNFSVLVTVKTTTRGAKRIRNGHLWVYRSDVRDANDALGGQIVRVTDEAGNPIGQAFYSDRSEIALRFLTTGEETIDRAWWHRRLRQCAARRGSIALETNAYRLVYSEGDLLPSLIIDVYNDVFVMQTLSQGTEQLKSTLAELLVEEFTPRVIVERNDARVRELEGLERRTATLYERVTEPGAVATGSYQSSHKENSYDPVATDTVSEPQAVATGSYQPSHKENAYDPVATDTVSEPQAVATGSYQPSRAFDPVATARGSETGPDQIEINQHGVHFVVSPVSGQKTGAFLDQRENYLAARRVAHGRALDCFTFNGGFALHIAASCETVLGIDISDGAVAAAQRNADRNGASNVEFRAANVFDALREFEANGERFDTIVLDPPAFAKNRASLSSATRGYKEINLRALKLLNPGGVLVTCTCSYHVSEEMFLEIIADAALDARRRVQLVEKRGQSSDHPVLLGVPETHYLKCVIARVVE
jgi:23S rRNA G2069 N7-methylase RlmK/C1962 C5-methylase RlmI